MQTRSIIGAIAALGCFAGSVAAGSVEPNDFASGTTLDAAVPGVTLSAEGGLVSGSVVSETSDFASTGDQVFRAAGLFGTTSGFNNATTLIAEFDAVVQSVSLDFIGIGLFGGDGTPLPGFDTTAATLTAFDIDGTQIDQVTTTGIARGEVRTLSVFGSIASVTANNSVAGLASSGPGAIDNLSVVVPSPSAAAAGLAMLGGLAWRRRLA